MFGFRRRIKPEVPTDWATVEQVRRIVEERIDDAVGSMAKRLRNEMESLRSLLHDAQDDVGAMNTRFDGFEKTIYAEVRTLCQNAAEATRAIADAMDMWRPTLMKIRERAMKKEAAKNECPKES